MSTGSNVKNSENVVHNKPRSILQWAGVFRPHSIGLFVLLGVALVSGLSVVNTTHKNRFSFNELQELREQANALEVEWGQLLIEQSTFGVEGRVEQKALDQLQMHVPEISRIVMVSRE
jgi:cell division protein FtsL